MTEQSSLFKAQNAIIDIRNSEKFKKAQRKQRRQQRKQFLKDILVGFSHKNFKI